MARTRDSEHAELHAVRPSKLVEAQSLKEARNAVSPQWHTNEPHSELDPGERLANGLPTTLHPYEG